MTEPEILEIFREESLERLDRMVEILLALESGPTPPDALNSLFRHAHSIKGSAGMVGVSEAQLIARALEDVLEDVRDRGVFPSELTHPLLRATDALRSAVDGGTDVAEPALRELTGLISAGDDNGHENDPVPDAPEPSALASPSPSERPVTNGSTPAVRPVESRLIRTSAAKVDRLLDAVGETVLQSRRLEHLLTNSPSAGAPDERIEEALGRSETLLDALQESVLQMRTMPLSTITGPFPRAIRDLAAVRGIDVDLTIRGAETQLDRVMLDGISDTITHLLRNAVAHGIELPEERARAGKPARGRIELRAEQRGGLVAIEVRDDGRGVSAQLIGEAGDDHSLADVLSEAGFSTAEEITDVSGRGVGLDAVKAHIESLGGELAVHSEPGHGTTVTLTVPLTLALLRVLLLTRGGQTFGVPLTSVEEVVTVSTKMALGGREAIELRDHPVQLVDLADIIGAAAPPLANVPQAVIVTSSGRRVAAACDRIVEEQEVVVKSLGSILDGVSGYLGATILGDGAIALILDPASLTKSLSSRARSGLLHNDKVPSKVLVVDDQFTVRELQRSILEAAGYHVETASDGLEALTCLDSDPQISLMVTDIDMPKMGGIELLRTLRAAPSPSSLPVVVVSARGDQEDRRKGIEAGADAYIVKGDFDQQVLLETVQRLTAA
jgi:two-component system, chemotaxis family, sensor kinase CheA